MAMMGAAATMGAAPQSPAGPDLNPGEQGGMVTGWLVVLDGPGRGRALPLSYGRNIIGAGPGAGVVLDFGDDKIPETRAADLIYDHVSHAFHLVRGEGDHSIFVNDAYLGGARLMADGDVIALGATRLVFKPFCSAGFNWEARAPRARCG